MLELRDDQRLRLIQFRPDVGSRRPDLTESEPVRFETKVAVLLATDIASWQQLNVTAFLVAGIARAVGDIMGEPYQDADGTPYLALLRQPVAVLEGDRELLAQPRRRSLQRELLVAIYTEDMFATGDDEANRATVISVAGDDLNLVGIAVHGPRNKVDKALKGARLHS